MSDNLRDLFLEVDLTADRQQDLERRVMSAVAKDRKGRHGRRFAWIIGIIAALSIGGVGVSTAWIISDRPDDPNTAWCYPTTTLDRSDGWGGTQVYPVETSTGRKTVMSALDMCASTWRYGIVRTPGHKVVEGKPVNPVPELTACVLSNHETAVLPGDRTTCSRLGLPSLNKDFDYPPHLAP